MGRSAVDGLIAEGDTFTDENWGSIVEAEFQDCTFVACNFGDARWQAVRFIGCTFQRCDVSLAKPTDCTIGDSRFEDCRMLGVDWTLAVWPRVPLHEPNTFVRCDLSMSTFADLVLGATRFEECRLREASYRNSGLVDSVFDGSDCAGTDFRGADLSGASLQEVTGLSVDPRSTRLEGATVDPSVGVAILESLGINLTDGRPSGR